MMMNQVLSSRRRRLATGSLALLVSLAGCRGERAPDRRSQQGPPQDSSASDSAGQQRPTIVFLGTSLTAGLGLDPDQAYPALIQRKVDSAGLRFRVVNAGVSGESSAGTLRRIDWILRASPAVLVIETGANDGLRGQSPDSLRANIQAIIDSTRSHSPETRIVLAGMEVLPNLGMDYRKRFHAVYPALAKVNAVPLIPFLLAGVAGYDSLNQHDGIHPNARGAEIVATNVWSVLAPVIRESGP